MKLNSSEIYKIIKKRINNFDFIQEKKNEGTIISINDGIIRIVGLSEVMQGEMLILSKNLYGLALNLEKDIIGAVVLGSYIHLKEGMRVYSTGKVLEVPVGNNFLGRIVNSLGIPIDNKGEINADKYLPIESQSPGVIERESISEPLQTGYKCIDTIIPIGKGQRELIIGDRQTGKSSLAIDTIINQNTSGVKCIYVAIGQKMSTILNVVQKLEIHNSLNNTIIVVASASESAALQYIAPYSGCSMGEFFRNKGEDALIIYDDLTKHAIAYRQISLLLKRPPGREAFPGDVFYLHSRLLERSARVNISYIHKYTKNKKINTTGSLTSLPIVETQAGDVSSFIPTNIISITDGQIFLESNLFNSGIRPAVNTGISVSRVGSIAQTKIIKKLSGGIRTALAQYSELASFSQFSSDLDLETQKQLLYGQKITELLKQKQYHPLSIAEQSILLFSAVHGYLEDISIQKIRNFEKKILYFFKSNYFTLFSEINLKGDYNDKIKKDFNILITEFKKNIFL
ncbi:F0F1 ATP synthase subunit alpha [Buchnera aphidicola (Kurisakia onigurumii)]|uniref:F0F1 ATP synthase subunit alpha n=1 Tax=Buchnera aphidicola TaxID=9 RepID=UPI0031B7039B